MFTKEPVQKEHVAYIILLGLTSTLTLVAEFVSEGTSNLEVGGSNPTHGEN